MTSLDDIFHNDLTGFVNGLKGSQDIEWSAQAAADEYFETGTPIEDQELPDAIGEDLMQIVKDEVYGLVADNPDEVWDLLCKENDKGTLEMYAHGSEKNLVNAYYGKPYDTAVDNGETSDLNSLMEGLLLSLYVQTEGGWFDEVYDAYIDAEYERYNEIVANNQ